MLLCVYFTSYSTKKRVRFASKKSLLYSKRCCALCVCSVCYLLCVFRKVMAFNGSGLVGDGPQSKRLCTGKPGENNDSGNNNNNKVSQIIVNERHISIQNTCQSKALCVKINNFTKKTFLYARKYIHCGEMNM